MTQAFVLTVVLTLAACSEDEMHATAPPNQPNPADTLPSDSHEAANDTIYFNYLALGDSYTIGTGLPDGNGRYPVQLVNRLIAEDKLKGDAATVIAQNGWTTGNLIAAIDNSAIDTTFSLVSLLIGVNNQFQNRPIAEFSTHFEALLETAIAFAGGDTSQVFVLSIPDYGVTPFGQGYNPVLIAEQIDAYNTISQEICGSFNVSYFDITTISREVSSTPGMLAPDNLHPSAQHYALWVDAIYEHIKIKLNE